MTQTADPTGGERELVLNRLLKAPRAALWRCWTEPALLKQWFCPAPWTIAHDAAVPSTMPIAARLSV